MTKEMSRRSFLKGLGALAGVAAVSGLAGCSNRKESSTEAIYTPGTYTATAAGYDSDVTVTVTFDETHITEVVVDSSGETESVGAAAADTLASQVLNAQSSAIDGVTGATHTSKAVKEAVAECIKQASGGTIVEGGDVAVTEEISPETDTEWLGEAPDVAESDITETVETEILVVGAGNAGLMTAARAASLGSKVTVIEKGVSSMNERHWIGAIDSTVAKESGIDVDKDEVVQELARYASHRCDERIIRLWANHSGEMIDWYHSVVQEYNPDVELHYEYDTGEDHAGYIVPPTMHNFQDHIEENVYSEACASYGLSSLTSKVNDNGGEIRYQTSLVKLEQNEEGRVTGVIAEDADGNKIRIHAEKGVVLCCGGYAYNKSMLATLNPDAYNSTVEADASALDTGDGIKAAMWIGADKDPDPTAMLFDRGIIAPGELVDGNWEKSGYFQMGSQPWLKVNLDGERFSNESVPYDFILHAASMEKNRLYNTIYDSNFVDQVKQFHQIGCARIEPSSTGGKLQIFSWEAEMGVLAAMEQAGFIQSADTLEELAEKLQMDPATFTSTVQRYNELCEKGVDEDFGKPAYRMMPLSQAPYYGVRQGASLLCTLDGLRINTKMQVLDTNHEVIEGLYAAGDCSGGFFAHNYPEYIVGVAVGRTLTEGYLVGTELANA